MCLSIYIDKLYISPLLRDSCPFNHNVTVVCQNTSEFCYQTNGLVMVRTVWTLWNSTRTKFLSLCFSWLKQRRHFGFSLVPAVAEALVWAFLHSVKKHAIVNFFYFFFFIFWPVWKFIPVCMSVCLCVDACVVKNKWADIDEGRLSQEMYATVCNPSSYSKIIKTLVPCDDRNRS